jgi:hypothetical protein
LTECICIAELVVTNSDYRDMLAQIEAFWNLLPHINEKYLTTISLESLLQAERLTLGLSAGHTPPGFDSNLPMETYAMLFSAKGYKVTYINIFLMLEIFYYP